jgi:hypothetical protein
MTPSYCKDGLLRPSFGTHQQWCNFRITDEIYSAFFSPTSQVLNLTYRSAVIRAKRGRRNWREPYSLQLFKHCPGSYCPT